VVAVLFKKRGTFTEEDARKVIEIVSERPDEREIIVMAERVTDEAKRRLWDYARGVQLMADMTGEDRSVRVEILEGYVSEHVKGVELQ
jgi:galactokinase